MIFLFGFLGKDLLCTYRKSCQMFQRSLMHSALLLPLKIWIAPFGPQWGHFGLSGQKFAFSH